MINKYMEIGLPHIPLRMHFYGEEICTPHHVYGPAVRDHYLFVYVVRGAGVYGGSEGEAVRLGAGDAFFMTPGRLGFYRADRRDPWEYRWIGFNGTQAGDMLAQAGIGPERLVCSFSDAAEIGQLFDRLLRLEGDREYRELFANGVLLQMLALLRLEAVRSGTAPDALSTGESRHVRAALRFMELNYAERIGVASVADHVGLERSYFAKLFKRQTGQSPHDYLHEVRMRKAASLLTDGDLSVEYVGYSCGFQHLNHFSAAFSQFYGLPPSRYRKRMREEGNRQLFREIFE